MSSLIWRQFFGSRLHRFPVSRVLDSTNSANSNLRHVRYGGSHAAASDSHAAVAQARREKSYNENPHLGRGKDMYEQVLVDIAPIRSKLLQHPMYSKLTNMNAVKIFMLSHCFSVWDFMSLLKEMQHRLCPSGAPWVPVSDCNASRLVNEIVLGEETDGFGEMTEATGAEFMSHMELYLQAMRDMNVDTSHMEFAIDNARLGLPIFEGFDWSSATSPAETVYDFVNFTMDVCKSDVSTHEIISCFLFGRENVIPPMFEQIQHFLPTTNEVSLLRMYIDRHIEVDGGTEEEDGHGEMGAEMLINLVGDDPKKWKEVRDMAIMSLEHRYHLWDGVGERITSNILQINQ